MDKCTEYVELISAYVDYQLTEDEMARVEDHLESCENCSALLDFYREISISASKSCVPAPDALRANVMEKVLCCEPISKAGNANRQKIVRTILTRYLPVAACLAVILISLPWVINNQGLRYNEMYSGSGESANMVVMDTVTAAGGAAAPQAPAMTMPAEAPMPSTPIAPAPESAPVAGDSSSMSGGVAPAPEEYAPAPAPSGTVAAEDDADGYAEPGAEFGSESEAWRNEDGRLPALPQAVVDENTLIAFADAYAWIEINGDLPELLSGYEPEPLNGKTGFNVYFIIPRDVAQVLMKESEGYDGYDFQIKDRGSDYAVVFFLQSG